MKGFKEKLIYICCKEMYGKQRDALAVSQKETAILFISLINQITIIWWISSPTLIKDLNFSIQELK